MNWIAIGALCGGLAAGQIAGEPTGAPPDEAEIERLVVRLGADKLVDREDAMRRLWEAGRAAQAALERAAESTDAERRFRARAVLDRFEFGILPATPPDVVQMIQRFRGGDPATRQDVLKKLADRQQFDAMLSLIRTEKDENQRRAWLQMFVQDPAGVVGQLVLAERWNELERLLEFGANNPDGASIWVSYLASRGGLEAAVARQRERAAAAGADAERLLAYLTRAQGNLDEAFAAAQRAGDKPLQRALAVERGDWAFVARLHDQGVVDLPSQLLNARGITGPNRQVELLGFAAAFHRLAGNDEQFRVQVAALRKLAEDNAKNPSLNWYCAEALLINGRVEDAYEVLKIGNPVARFDLYCYQHRYDEAFAWVQWKPGRDVDEAWFDALPAIAVNTGLARQNRFRLAVYLARVIHHLGYRDDAGKLLELLRSIAAATTPAKHQTSPDLMWVLLGATEARMGMKERGYEHIGKVLASGDQYHHLRNVFGSRAPEAEAWFRYSMMVEQDRSPGRLLQIVDRRLAWSRDVSADTADLESIVGGLKDLLKDVDDATGQTIRHGIAATCRARKRPDLARVVVEPIVEKSGVARLLRADALFDERRWADASAEYEAAWQADRQQLASLWMSGYCAEQAGEAETGKKRRDQADVLALTAVARHALAAGIAARGLVKEAAGQWERILRTGPFEHHEVNDSARLLADTLPPADAARAADLWQRHMLADLRVYFSFLEFESYLRFPWLIHKARATAALAANDLPAAGREIDAAATLAPNDVRLVEHLAPFFDRPATAATMNELFERTCDHFRRMIAEFPNGPEFHNNLAWMCARSHRRLDEAQRWAERAVELAPDEANYLDTLAEVCFHQGRRDEALQRSRKCVEMAPREATFRRQLERFEKAPLPTGPVAPLIDEE